ncbi:MAG TPA: DUF2911 domain-containing protein [Blastocatellia bacterium]|nr:DUF2911 domain-containing protein [Blastocatellia bacterium]
MKRSIISSLFVALLTCAALAQSGERGTAQVEIKGKKISVDYGRPSLHGRDMLSQATVGTVWRVGMNQATQIETAGDLTIGGKVVKAGKYTLWAKKTGATTWTLGFHPKTGVWGAPELTEGYIAELPLTQGSATDSAEQLTITLSEDNRKCRIKIQWGTATLTGSFDVG